MLFWPGLSPVQCWCDCPSLLVGIPVLHWMQTQLVISETQRNTSLKHIARSSRLAGGCGLRVKDLRYLPWCQHKPNVDSPQSNSQYMATDVWLMETDMWGTCSERWQQPKVTMWNHKALAPALPSPKSRLLLRTHCYVSHFPRPTTSGQLTPTKGD